MPVRERLAAQGSLFGIVKAQAEKAAKLACVRRNQRRMSDSITALRNAAKPDLTTSMRVALMSDRN